VNDTIIVAVMVRFRPFNVPEYADSDGYLTHEFGSNREAWAWAKGNVSLVEEAYFTGNGYNLIHNGYLVKGGYNE